MEQPALRNVFLGTEVTAYGSLPVQGIENRVFLGRSRVHYAVDDDFQVRALSVSLSLNGSLMK